jgi:hypothetical protein
VISKRRAQYASLLRPRCLRAYVPRCAGSAEIIHHPMKHGLNSRVVDSPYSTFRRLVAEGVYPEGRAGGYAAQYASLLRPTCRGARGPPRSSIIRWDTALAVKWWIRPIPPSTGWSPEVFIPKAGRGDWHNSRLLVPWRPPPLAYLWRNHHNQ